MAIFHTTYTSKTSSGWSSTDDSLTTYTIYEDPRHPIKEIEMDANKIKAPILRGLVKAGIVGSNLRILALGTAKQVSEYFPDSSYYGAGLAARHDPVSNKDGLSKAASYSVAIVFYCVDYVEELIQKANIVWEALTALYPDYVTNAKTGRGMPPQAIIFSKTMHIDELLNLAMYAGAKSATELTLDGIEGVCITASVFEK